MNILFGGTGFIGIHYARKILAKKTTDKIILADIKDIEEQFLFDDVKAALKTGLLQYIYCDVRNYSTFKNLPANVISLIGNFAAIHREPGHHHEEYYNTNIPGAENVCRFAEEVNCPSIVFTSSIAVYQPTEDPKDEMIIPAPISAYGGSKLVAEKIHLAWQKSAPNLRKLVIVRPGVVYGPSEGGNVTRMIKMIKMRAFVFVGNRATRKASIYVKELLAMIDYYLYEIEDKYILSNAVVPQPPSMDEYVGAVKTISGWKRFVPNIPFFLIYLASFPVAGLTVLLGKKSNINPVRVQKLRRINNIISKTLPDTNYSYKYSLETAFADWYDDCKFDW